MHHTFKQQEALRCVKLYPPRTAKPRWPGLLVALRKVLSTALDRRVWTHRLAILAVGLVMICGYVGVLSLADLIARWFAS